MSYLVAGLGLGFVFGFLFHAFFATVRATDHSWPSAATFTEQHASDSEEIREHNNRLQAEVDRVFAVGRKGA